MIIMKHAISILFILIISYTARGVIAHPGVATVAQPDSSLVDIILHGDEFFSFVTTNDYYTLVKDADGFYRYAKAVEGELKSTGVIAHSIAERDAYERHFVKGLAKK